MAAEGLFQLSQHGFGAISLLEADEGVSQTGRVEGGSVGCFIHGKEKGAKE